MSVIQNNLLLTGGEEGYNLTRSLRFRSSASASLSRTPASAGNRQKWTWSGWIKRGALGTNNCFFSQGNNIFVARFNNNTDVLEVYDVTGGPYQLQLITSQVFRDPSAWYHLVIATDTTQATASNRVKIYLNGTQITAFSTATYYSQNYNTEVNTTDVTNIGALAFVGQYFDGYLTEINFADGSQLTPSSFGETDLTTGVWKPKRYAGTYGTNGFYLPFTDNSALTTSSNAGLGKDFSGNGNYWTTNNISITSGVTYDSMTDVPTLTSATAANFAVLNPLDKTNGSVANGNLQFTYTSTSQGASVRSAVGMTSGKWYCEVTLSSYGGNNPMVGIIGIGENLGSTVDSYVGKYATGYAYILGNGGGISGHKINNTSSSAYGASTTTGDVIGLAFDADARTITFYKNNVSQGTAFSSIPAGTYCFAVSSLFSTVLDANFGQRPFAYTPPTGYVALNTYNLPTSTIVKGNTVMDATTYTGTGSTQSIVNAAGFKPDLVWGKSRSNTVSHCLVDSVRGVSKALFSNLTNAEDNSPNYYVTSFNSNGFGLNLGIGLNESGYTYTAWQWQAGQGTTSTNTNGTITSTVSVNASAGFSVVTYTGTGANATVGHGLGVAPSFIVVKCRNTAGENWQVYSSSLTSAAYRLRLNTTDAQDSQPTMWNSTAPTSSVFSVGTATGTNASTQTYVAYCFAPIAGYSAFGSYAGNGSTDGPFVYLGFRPKFILAKKISSSGDWNILDGQRDPYNAVGTYLNPNLSAAEGANASTLDFTANGFKLRQSYGNWNTAGETYIYACFAENPFKNSLAR